MLADLAEELIDEIFRQCEAPSLSSLCRTSKHLHAFAIKNLYSNLSLAHEKEAIGALSTVVKSPLAAASVRHICFELSSVSQVHEFDTLAATAISKTEALRSFWMNPSFESSLLDILCLQKTCLPNLTRCILPHTAPSYRFLCQHPTIEHLSFPGPMRPVNFSNDADRVEAISLPNLMSLSAFASFVPLLSKDSSPIRVEILWTTEDVEDEKMIISLIPKSVEYLENAVIRWGRLDHFVAVLAKCVQNVAGMRFWSPDFLASSIDLQELAQVIWKLDLTPFTSLKVISIDLGKDVPVTKVSALFAHLNNELEIINRWGMLYPSLSTVRLPFTRTMWTRSHDTQHTFSPKFVDNKHLAFRLLWYLKATSVGKLPVNPSLKEAWTKLKSAFDTFVDLDEYTGEDVDISDDSDESGSEERHDESDEDSDQDQDEYGSEGGDREGEGDNDEDV